MEGRKNRKREGEGKRRKGKGKARGERGEEEHPQDGQAFSSFSGVHNLVTHTHIMEDTNGP